MSKLFFFDLETTGVRYWKDGIHQLGYLVEIDDQVKEQGTLFVQPNPKAEISVEALAASGTTLDDIKGYTPFNEGYKQIVSILGKYVNKFDKRDKFTLVGYNNASFDNNFFRAFFKQNGDEYFGSWFWSSDIDVMRLAASKTFFERADMDNFKLHTVCKWFGIDVDESRLHQADYDIQLTRELFLALIQ